MDFLHNKLFHIQDIDNSLLKMMKNLKTKSIQVNFQIKTINIPFDKCVLALFLQLLKSIAELKRPYFQLNN